MRRAIWLGPWVMLWTVTWAAAHPHHHDAATSSGSRLETPEGSASRLEASSTEHGGQVSGARGDVYRYPEKPAPMTGPSQASLNAKDAATLRQGATSKDHLESVPGVEVRVVDAAGRGVPGVGVNFGVRGGKGGTTVHYSGATGGDGAFRFHPGLAASAGRMTCDLAWDGGAKVITTSLKPKASGWEDGWAGYRFSPKGDAEGDCRNLIDFTESSGGDLLTLHQPDSLLACDSVAYGIDRHSSDLARIDEIGHRDINHGDKNFFSRSDEQKMAAEATSNFDKELEILDDSAITGYVQQLMERVVAASDDPAMKVTARVVHTNDVNAFATAGGNVYVFTGLIKTADDESELAGVLAHELSHVLARHVTEGATRQTKAQAGTLLGALILGAVTHAGDKGTQSIAQGLGAGAGLIGLKYDRRAETEADLLGEQYLWHGGWDPEGIGRFFAAMQAVQKGGAPPAILSDHPSDDERIRNNRNWARAFLPARERYLVDTAAFQECRKRVAALPPPRKKPATQDGKAKALRPDYGATAAWAEILARELSPVQ